MATHTREDMRQQLVTYFQYAGISLGRVSVAGVLDEIIREYGIVDIERVPDGVFNRIVDNNTRDETLLGLGPQAEMPPE